MNLLSTADVHVLPVERHEEIQSIFNQIKQIIIDRKIDVFVIAGDLYHSKLSLTPEAAVMLQNFFEEFSLLVKLVVIPGNHDANLSNNQRMDALSPFINSINKRRSGETVIDYYLKSGIYYYKDIAFVTESIIDDQLVDTEDVKKIDKNDYKIVGLLHGSFEGCVDEYGFKLSGKDLPNWIEYCNFVILGDIHKRQTLKYQ